MSPLRLYSILGTLLVAGYAWLGWSAYTNHTAATLCLMKQVSGLPCPSCGTTRGITLLLEGRIAGALQMNPLSAPALLLLLALPAWLLLDVFTGSKSLYQFYNRAENLFRIRLVAIAGVLLIGCNWIWNIWKQL